VNCVEPVPSFVKVPELLKWLLVRVPDVPYICREKAPASAVKVPALLMLPFCI
jgi:hypothetical protein